ncbi:hypothetical protein [Bradyrhizobium prioriisuperbiae]|uniref:hypothetical protein n=1 Tax=Bradyrhizobium prioriisuperbiae TaxID=2854389 RepID=UPI0028E328CE|nr:hypothetical protein [Bradyrhizobium prioritasuperba]
MTNTTYLASTRIGTQAGAGPGSRRISVTLRCETFAALQAAADAAHRGLSGEAAEAIERDLARAEVLRAGRAE